MMDKRVFKFICGVLNMKSEILILFIRIRFRINGFYRILLQIKRSRILSDSGNSSTDAERIRKINLSDNRSGYGIYNLHGYGNGFFSIRSVYRPRVHILWY